MVTSLPRIALYAAHALIGTRLQLVHALDVIPPLGPARRILECRPNSLHWRLDAPYGGKAVFDLLQVAPILNILLKILSDTHCTRHHRLLPDTTASCRPARDGRRSPQRTLADDDIGTFLRRISP
jgi:hypothetical protein